MGLASRALWIALPLAGPAVLLLLWQIAWSVGVAPRVLLPSVGGTLLELGRLVVDPEFLLDVWQTVRRTIIGLLLSIGLGVPIGLVIGQGRRLSRGSSLLIDFLRSIPAPSLFPLAILFLGITDASKIAIAIYACTLLLVVQTAYGARQVSSVRRDVLTLAGATSAQRMRFHLLPEIAPFVAAGSRLATSLALVLIIVAEMLMGGGDGLGGRISDAQAAYRIEELYATIISVGLLGYGFNLISWRLEARLAFWEDKSRGDSL